MSALVFPKPSVNCLACTLLLFLGLSSLLHAQQELSARLRVGVIQSLTGIASEDGTTALRGLQLAAEELNRGASPKVELIVEDDATDAKQSVAAFRKLVQQNVDVVVGPTWGFTVNSVLPLLERAQVPLVNTSTVPECLDLEKAHGWAFTSGTSVQEHARIFEDYLKQRHVASVALFYTNNSWGEAQRKAYRAVLDRLGVKVIREMPGTNSDTNEWRALLPVVKAQQPELWLLLVNKADLDTLVRQIRTVGVGTAVYASYHFADVLRLHSGESQYGDVCYSLPWEISSSSADFAAKYKNRFGVAPQAFADNSYDTLFLLAHAKREALKQQIPLREALLKTNYQGVVGTYHYTSQNSFSIGKGTLRCLKTESAITDPKKD